MTQPRVHNATHFDTVYDRLLRAERERDVLAARVEFLETALLEQVAVCEICSADLEAFERAAGDG